MTDLIGRSKADLYTLARSHRLMVRLFGLSILLAGATMGVQAWAMETDMIDESTLNGLVFVLLLAAGFAGLASLPAVWRVLRLTGVSIWLCVVAMAATLIPLGLYVVLVVASGRATTVLRALGFRVGILGPTRETLLRLRAAHPA